VARTVSARHALTEQEFDFCKRHLAGLPAATAYRRAFFIEKGGVTYESIAPNGDGENEVSSKEVSRRASTLLTQDHIQAYLAEITNPAGDQARAVLLEKAVFDGDRQAAQSVVDQEDKHNLRDAYEHWAMVMCAIGTEVVVDVPGGGQVIMPMKALFPQYAEALPPDDVVKKTIKTLQQFLTRHEYQTEKVADLEENPS
jgi:hypothetical protein